MKVASGGLFCTRTPSILTNAETTRPVGHTKEHFKDIFMKMGESQRTFNDVVTYQADANFAVKTIKIPNLAVEVQPGSVIKADGTAFTSGNDALLVLSHHRAGTDANIIVADRGVYIRPETVIAVMGGTVGTAAIAALTASGNIRVAQADAQ
ncbi:hypothetical protein [Klebsiella pneumoniae]|uniref:hypothetical protein n=1 Tax=Klebsiella pneumoniae TaxID=573 RepID=UPI003F5714CD